jgi:(2S)-methylsuccinyl-CoA dehydrogenase
MGYNMNQVAVRQEEKPFSCGQTAAFTSPLPMAHALIDSLDSLLQDALSATRTLVAPNGSIDSIRLDTEQHSTHALAWIATHVEAVRALINWAAKLHEQGRFGDLESLLLRLGMGEYTAQIFGGIPMSASETARLSDVGLHHLRIADHRTPIIEDIIADALSPLLKIELLGALSASGFFKAGTPAGDSGYSEALDRFCLEVRKFTNSTAAPYAHAWHLSNSSIPFNIIEQMAGLGVLGLSVPREHGGHGLTTDSMVAVSEELSCTHMALGSLVRHGALASELIWGNGTPEQKQKWLPRIASGEVIASLAFCEPHAGSDLNGVRMRAVRDTNVYRLSGNKAWVTNAMRADLLLVLCRTDDSSRSMSVFMVEKPRGTDDEPFLLRGLTGTEIGTLGYRGLKHYELHFDQVKVPMGNLLGDNEGAGTSQIMKIFETSRLQAAAQSVGVAHSALEHAYQYALERVQFGKTISSFPRVANKLCLMAADIMIARQLARSAALEKSQGIRCEVKAEMAKMLAARVAWLAADNAVQIHGGNGIALDHPISRILCDARALNILEGTPELQAQFIARQLLER